MANTAGIRNKQSDPLQRLKPLGPQTLQDVPLLIPTRWVDLSGLTPSLQDLHQGQEVVVVARIVGRVVTRFGGRTRAPMSRFHIRTQNGEEAPVVMFGNAKEMMRQWEGKRMILTATADFYNAQLRLKAPKFYDYTWLGRSIPVYPGKAHTLSAESTRALVGQLLDAALPFCESALLALLQRTLTTEQILALIEAQPGQGLADILRAAHQPRNFLEAADAIHSLKRLAALLVMVDVECDHKTRDAKSVIASPQSVDAHLAMTPFALTDEQRSAVISILSDWEKPYTTHRILTGDVSTGKTITYATPAAIAADNGAILFVLTYNAPLVEQIASEIRAVFPHVNVHTLTAETKGVPALNQQGAIIVGTSALVARAQQLPAPHVVIVDEQHKFQSRQIEKLTQGQAHLLEATATCIPRTQALVEFGAINRSCLTQRHSPRTVHTGIWYREQRAQLGSQVMATLARGKQVMVIFPKRDATEEKSTFALVSPQQAPETESVDESELEMMARVAEWERRFPGQIAHVHGQMKEAEKNAVIDDFKAGRFPILLATVTVEVGMTVPNLERIVIIGGNRFGLAQLHQLRGRVARKDPIGYCDVYLPHPINDAAQERLDCFAATDNGWELAAIDMRQRGYGDLSSIAQRQSGHLESLMYRHKPEFDLVESVAKNYAQVRASEPA